MGVGKSPADNLVSELSTARKMQMIEHLEAAERVSASLSCVCHVGSGYLNLQGRCIEPIWVATVFRKLAILRPSCWRINAGA